MPACIQGFASSCFYCPHVRVLVTFNVVLVGSGDASGVTFVVHWNNNTSLSSYIWSQALYIGLDVKNSFNQKTYLFFGATMLPSRQNELLSDLMCKHFQILVFVWKCLQFWNYGAIVIIAKINYGLTSTYLYVFSTANPVVVVGGFVVILRLVIFGSDFGKIVAFNSN